MIYRRLVIALVVTLAVATAACAGDNDWTMARYSEAQTGYTPQKLTLPLTLCWQHNTIRSDVGGNPSAPAILGDTAYFTSGHLLFALNTTTGSLKWRFPAGAAALRFAVKTGITVWEDMLFFGGMDGKLYALNANTGHVLWSFTTGSAIRSTPVVSNGTVFFGSDDNSLYAVDARSGEISWTSGFRTDDDVAVSPAICPGMIVFTSLDTNVYGANIATGKLRWNYRLPSVTTRSAPVISGNYVFIGAGSSIHVLNVKSGQLRYVINLPTDIAAPPAVAGEDLYVVCRDWKLYAYKVGISDVKAKWSASVELKMPVTSSPTVAGDTVYIGTNRGMIYAFSAETGSFLWNYAAAPSIVGNGNQPANFTSITAPLVVANGSLYALTDDGSLRCFRNDTPDNTAPKLFNVVPYLGTTMSGHPPIPVSAILYDESTGIDPTSIQLLLDGERVEHKFDTATLKLTYETPVTSPVRPLSDRRHVLTILAADWKGNKLEYNWSFIVDNTLPPPKITTKDKTKTKAKKSKDTTAPQPAPPTQTPTQQPVNPGTINPGGDTTNPGGYPNPGVNPGGDDNPPPAPGGGGGGDGPPPPGMP